MKKSKVIFVIVSILFFLIMALFVFDFARRTTFPGHHDPTHTNQAPGDSTGRQDTHKDIARH
jgi:hypothetical protein